MLCRVLSGLGSVLLGSGSNTFAGEFSSSVNPKDGWKLAADTKEVIIYSRPHGDSNLKEFKAIGPIDAPITPCTQSSMISKIIRSSCLTRWNAGS